MGNNEVEPLDNPFALFDNEPKIYYKPLCNTTVIDGVRIINFGSGPGIDYQFAWNPN